MVFLGILASFNVIIPYTVTQYVLSGLVMFVSAEVLEGNSFIFVVIYYETCNGIYILAFLPLFLDTVGVNLSLLSRVMSSRLSRGTYNGGLLSTEAGTIARVIADATITLGGYAGESRLLNVTLLPSLAICILTIICTCLTYNSQY